MPAEMKPITTIVQKKEIDTVKSIFKELKDRLPNLESTPFKYGRLGDKHILSFKVDSKYLNLFVETFTFNRIKILFLDKEQKDLVERVNDKLERKDDTKSVDWSSLKETKSNASQKSLAQIDHFIKHGEYAKLITISRDISQSKDIIEKAAKNVSVSVSNAIEIQRGRAENSKHAVDDAIKKLISIAGDKTLKNIGQSELMKIAGQLAVNLSCIHRKHLDNLIVIANSNSVPYIVSMRAAIQLGDILMDHPDEYEDDLELAIRQLNVRWLENTYDVVQQDLDPHEIETFHEFNRFLVEKRNAK